MTHLAKQMYPGKLNYVQESYKAATSSLIVFLFFFYPSLAEHSRPSPAKNHHLSIRASSNVLTKVRTMSACIKRNLPLLKVLCGAKPALIKAVLKGTSPDLINTLSECSLNILKGHVCLTSAWKKQLCRYKQSLHALSKKGTSLKRRKQILQKGGYLGALLKPVWSVLGRLLGPLVL